MYHVIIVQAASMTVPQDRVVFLPVATFQKRRFKKGSELANTSLSRLTVGPNLKFNHLPRQSPAALTTCVLRQDLDKTLVKELSKHDRARDVQILDPAPSFRCRHWQTSLKGNVKRSDFLSVYQILTSGFTDCLPGFALSDRTCVILTLSLEGPRDHGDRAYGLRHIQVPSFRCLRG